MTAFILKILCFTQKPGPARQDTDFAKITKFQDFSNQRKRSLCSRKFQIQHFLTNLPAHKNSQQNFNKTLFGHRCTRRVHNPLIPFAKYSITLKFNPATLFAKFSNYIPKSFKLSKLYKITKIQILANNANDRSVR